MYYEWGSCSFVVAKDMVLKLLSPHSSPCYRKIYASVGVVKECPRKKEFNKCSAFNV